MPTSPTRHGWTLWVFALVLYMAVDTPLLIAFETWRDLVAVNIMGWVVSATLCFDLLVQFRTCYTTEKGEIIRDARLIALHYLRTMFLLDLLSSLPIDEVVEATTTGSVHRSVYWLGLLRLPRLFILFSHMTNMAPIRYVSFVAVVRLIMIMLLVTHWSACLWYYLSTELRGLPWIFTVLCPKCSARDLYLFSFYRCFLTLLGDRPMSYNNVERSFSIFLLFMGACMYAVVMGSMTLLISNMWSMASRHRQRATMVRDTLRYQGASADVRNKVDEYFDWMAQYDHPGAEGVILLSELPTPLHGELLATVFEPIFAKVQLFANCERPFIWRLAQRMRLVLYMPRDVVYDIGSVGHDMYAVWKGAVGLVDPDGCMVALMSDGEHFGELGLMVASTPRPHKAVALQASDVMLLNRWDLQDAMRDFPDSAALVKGRARVQLEDHEIGLAVWMAMPAVELAQRQWERPRPQGRWSSDRRAAATAAQRRNCDNIAMVNTAVAPTVYCDSKAEADAASAAETAAKETTAARAPADSPLLVQTRTRPAGAADEAEASNNPKGLKSTVTRATPTPADVAGAVAAPSNGWQAPAPGRSPAAAAAAGASVRAASWLSPAGQLKPIAEHVTKEEASPAARDKWRSPRPRVAPSSGADAASDSSPDDTLLVPTPRGPAGPSKADAGEEGLAANGVSNPQRKSTRSLLSAFGIQAGSPGTQPSSNFSLRRRVQDTLVSATAAASAAPASPAETSGRPNGDRDRGRPGPVAEATRDDDDEDVRVEVLPARPRLGVRNPALDGSSRSRNSEDSLCSFFYPNGPPTSSAPGTAATRTAAGGQAAEATTLLPPRAGQGSMVVRGDNTESRTQGVCTAASNRSPSVSATGQAAECSTDRAAEVLVLDAAGNTRGSPEHSRHTALHRLLLGDQAIGHSRLMRAVQEARGGSVRGGSQYHAATYQDSRKGSFRGGSQFYATHEAARGGSARTGAQNTEGRQEGGRGGSSREGFEFYPGIETERSVHGPAVAAAAAAGAAGGVSGGGDSSPVTGGMDEVAPQREGDSGPQLLLLPPQPFLGVDPLGTLIDDAIKLSNASNYERRRNYEGALSPPAPHETAGAGLTSPRGRTGTDTGDDSAAGGGPRRGARSSLLPSGTTTAEAVRLAGDDYYLLSQHVLSGLTRRLSVRGGPARQAGRRGSGTGSQTRPAEGGENTNAEGMIEEWILASHQHQHGQHSTCRNPRCSLLEQQLAAAQQQLQDVRERVTGILENPFAVPAVVSAFRREVDAVRERLNARADEMMTRFLDLLTAMTARTEDLSLQVNAADDRLQRLEEDHGDFIHSGAVPGATGSVVGVLLDSQFELHTDVSDIPAPTEALGLGSGPHSKSLLAGATASPMLPVSQRSGLEPRSPAEILPRQPSSRHNQRRLSAFEYLRSTSAQPESIAALANKPPIPALDSPGPGGSGGELRPAAAGSVGRGPLSRSQTLGPLRDKSSGSGKGLRRRPSAYDLSLRQPTDKFNRRASLLQLDVDLDKLGPLASPVTAAAAAGTEPASPSPHSQSQSQSQLRASSRTAGRRKGLDAGRTAAARLSTIGTGEKDAETPADISGGRASSAGRTSASSADGRGGDVSPCPTTAAGAAGVAGTVGAAGAVPGRRLSSTVLGGPSPGGEVGSGVKALGAAPPPLYSASVLGEDLRQWTDVVAGGASVDSTGRGTPQGRGSDRGTPQGRGSDRGTPQGRGSDGT